MARDWKDNGCKSETERHTPSLATHAGGSLNPEWVEWLMGWPRNWTSLEPVKKADFELWKDSGAQWWADEQGLERVSTKTENRSNRIKCIGNGQVPITAAKAWERLSKDHDE
jgi:hypothetical protein